MFVLKAKESNFYMNLEQGSSGTKIHLKGNAIFLEFEIIEQTVNLVLAITLNLFNLVFNMIDTLIYKYVDYTYT